MKYTYKEENNEDAKSPFNKHNVQYDLKQEK